MKKIVITLGLLASLVTLAGCYNKACDQNMSQQPVAKQDYKGEVGK